MSGPSRMCWCDDMACRFVYAKPDDECPTPRPQWADKNGYDKHAVNPSEKWNGRLFTCSPSLSPTK
jgi:hypothetical protein